MPKKITNTNQKRLLMTPLRNNTGPVNDMRIPLLNFVQKPNGVIKIQLWSILVFDLPKNALLSLSRMWYSFVFVISRFPKCKLVNTPPSKIITIIHVAIKIFVARSDMEIYKKIKNDTIYPFKIKSGSRKGSALHNLRICFYNYSNIIAFWL